MLIGGGMNKLRSIAMILVVLLLSSCSLFGRGGSGAGDDSAEGNIPGPGDYSILQTVHFAFDSAQITESAKGILSSNADWLKSNSSATVVIEGHCDERGTAEYNLALGERRARSVYDYLRSLGVTASQMSTISYGKELPLDPRSNEEAWAKNRRAQFAVTK